jgi:GMP synthase-like glutamine amidotransferase
MSVLILKNVPHEGPGTIEDFLRERKMAFYIIDLQSEELPVTESFDTLVIMGGPMSVNDTDQYPFVTKEIELVKEFINRGKKVLGVCLGAQIMATALGADVYPGPEKEIGWFDIEVEGNGTRDRLMTTLATDPADGAYRNSFKVFHWHGETYDMPEGSVRLARSELYRNQAFRYGKNVYALQFHVEVTNEMIDDWFKNDPVARERMNKETDLFCRELSSRAKNFYAAFFAP